MWSFEGDHRKKRNVSLSGASKVPSKNEFMKKLKEERAERENSKRRQAAAVKVQAVCRGWICRVRIYNEMRLNFDRTISSLKLPYSEDVLRSACFNVTKFYDPKHDEQRIILLCSTLMRSPNLLQWIILSPKVWSHIISDVIHLAMKAVIKPHNSTNGVNLTGPLRLLEILLQHSSWKSTNASNETVTKNVMLILNLLIDKGYFNWLIEVLVQKVPEVDEKTSPKMFPLAQSLITLFSVPFCLSNSSDDEKIIEKSLSSTGNIIQPTESSTSNKKDLVISDPYSEEFTKKCVHQFVGEILSHSHYSQVNKILIPYFEEEKYFLKSKGIIHAFIECFTVSSTFDKEGRDVHAPCKLYMLLSLIPVNSIFPLPTLQRFLQACCLLVKNIVDILPFQRDIPDEYGSDSEDEMEINETPEDTTPEDMVELGNWCINTVNSPEYVSWLLMLVEKYRFADSLLIEFCKLTHILLITPSISLFHCRLMYGVVGRQGMPRAIWLLLNSLYPSVNSSTASMSVWRYKESKLIELISRGVPIDPRDRDIVIPVLASFATALAALLATLHDTELVTPKPNPYEEKVDKKDVATEGSFNQFTVKELVKLSGTMKDVCVGLAELAHPDTRSSVAFIDTSHKYIWDHCFKSCVDVVRQLQLRDTRMAFCPSNHWLSSRIPLPDIKQIDVYQNLLSSSSQSTFLPLRFKNKSELLTEEQEGAQVQLTLYERVRATILKELPFVFPFTARAKVFSALINKDSESSHQYAGFNVSGGVINLGVRRTHLYEDSFDKLSPGNEPNVKLPFRVQYHNLAGAMEAGVDGGGLFREFCSDLIKTCFDPNRGFFLLTKDNTLYPNPAAAHLYEDFEQHYFFIGRILGKTLYERLLVEIPLASFFLNKLLSRSGSSAEFHHLDSLDPELCRNLLYLKTYTGDVQDLGLDFTVLSSEMGHNQVVELVANGANIAVTADNKIEYIYRMADYKLNRQIAKQCDAFRRGIFDVIPVSWLQLFDWRELQTVISGAKMPINIKDLKENSVYAGAYTEQHATIKIFWQVVEKFSEKQKSLLLKFVTSCSRPPLLGFKDLTPNLCIRPSGSDDRLPSAATCMNMLKLPEYSDPVTLKEKLLYAITSNAGFELS